MGQGSNGGVSSLPLLVSSLLFGWSLLKPLPRATSTAERLASIPSRDLPIEHEITIHWDDHQIPFIEAASDTDLAFALGLVHAHLRLGQMEISRRISQGRLAEMAGPLAVPIDHSLRILNFTRGVTATEAALPEESRAWLENFVHGINFYQANTPALPQEYSVLGLKREPWTVADILTIGRLSAADVNWLVWFPLLKLRERDDWPALWQRLVETGSASLPSFRKPRRLAFLSRLLGGLSRSGSNSFAVAAKRSKTGGTLMANDPHVNFTLPNLWLIVGCKSPSYHTVGLMLAGLPFFGLGRNQDIAWGGTNMRAASSDLYDISKLDAEEITERRETISVRGWFSHDIVIRETKFGPVLSDAPVFKHFKSSAFALRWLGHDVSDEITAFLKANRARNWQEFRQAFSLFAVPGLNMLYADVKGNIGQLMAVQLPSRNFDHPPDLILDPRNPDALWGERIGADDLPTSYNPRAGFLVSSNNRPVDANVPISYFFAPDDRFARINTLLDANAKIGVSDLESIQQDVYMASAAKLAKLIVDKIDALGLSDRQTANGHDLVGLLRSWDGHYTADSRGALAFELFLFHFTKVFAGGAFAEYAAAANSGVVRVKTLMIDDLDRIDPVILRQNLRDALVRAAPQLNDFVDWGDMHQIRLAHPLAFLPVVGGRYRFGDHPIGGSSDTVMKSAHGSTDERHFTAYGANARHISDLSDMDSNYFVMLGGQDGWFRSSAFLDQVPLWQSGQYVQVPLRLESVQAQFPHKTVLSPKKLN